MGYNYIKYNDNILIDLRSDTVQPDKLVKNYTAHDCQGNLIVGTASSSGGTLSLQDKIVIPSEAIQTISADSAYDGLGNVTVNAISSDYIGSNITQQDDSGTISLTDSVTSQTYAAGYYPNEHSVSHTTVSVPNPTLSINSSGLITASGSWTKGFTTNDSYSNMKQLTTLGATTYHPSTSNQIIASEKYLIGQQTINAVTTSNLSAANIKAGTTITVGDSSDADCVASISGTYTSDATASASDIVSGKTAYVNGSKITGTVSFNTFYSGTSEPSSSLGSDGDYYMLIES